MIPALPTPAAPAATTTTPSVEAGSTSGPDDPGVFAEAVLIALSLGVGAVENPTTSTGPDDATGPQADVETDIEVEGDIDVTATEASLVAVGAAPTAHRQSPVPDEASPSAARDDSASPRLAAAPGPDLAPARPGEPTGDPGDGTSTTTSLGVADLDPADAHPAVDTTDMVIATEAVVADEPTPPSDTTLEPVGGGSDDVATEPEPVHDLGAPESPSHTGHGQDGNPAEEAGRRDRSPVAALVEQLRTARPPADASAAGDRGIGAAVAAGVHAIHAEPTTPSAPTSPSPPPPPAAVADQVVEGVTPLLDHGDGTHEVTIDLDPADLGRVRLAVTAEDGVVSIRVLADDPATRRLLQDSLDQLRQSLESAGVRTGDLDVDQRRSTDGHDRSGPDARARDDAPTRDRHRPTLVRTHQPRRPTDALDVLL